jgi:hypothetical protein
MQTMYCWRCGMEVAMLNEEEFAEVECLYLQAVRTIKEQCRKHELSTQADFIQDQYRPALEAYRRLTGREHTTHPSDLLHHRISKYGPICLRCKKPLRTPKATYCAACGADRPKEAQHASQEPGK